MQELRLQAQACIESSDPQAAEIHLANFQKALETIDKSNTLNKAKTEIFLKLIKSQFQQIQIKAIRSICQFVENRLTSQKQSFENIYIDNDAILAFINNFMNIQELYQGTYVGHQVRSAIKRLLELLEASQESQDYELQKQLVREFLKEPVGQENKITSLAKKSNEGQQFLSINGVIDLLSDTNSLPSQIDLFVKCTAVFNTLRTSEQSPSIDMFTLQSLALLLDAMCFQTEYLIKLGDSTLRYILLAEQQILQQREDVLMTCLLLCQKILSCQEDQQMELLFQSFSFLSNAWKIFPQHRQIMEGLILKSFSQFIKCNGEMNPLVQSLYVSIKQSEAQLAQKIESMIQFQQELQVYYEVFTLENLFLKVAFPLNVQIKAGDKFQCMLYVEKNFSIISLSFATLYYDIGLQIVNMETKEEILPLNVYKSDMEPVNINILCQTSGFYNIIWDNSYSWLREKTLRYRLYILQLEQPDLQEGDNSEELKVTPQQETIQTQQEVKQDEGHQEQLQQSVQSSQKQKGTIGEVTFTEDSIQFTARFELQNFDQQATLIQLPVYINGQKSKNLTSEQWKECKKEEKSQAAAQIIENILIYYGLDEIFISSVYNEKQQIIQILHRSQLFSPQILFKQTSQKAILIFTQTLLILILPFINLSQQKPLNSLANQPFQITFCYQFNAVKYRHQNRYLEVQAYRKILKLALLKDRNLVLFKQVRQQMEFLSSRNQEKHKSQPQFQTSLFNQKLFVYSTQNAQNLMPLKQAQQQNLNHEQRNFLFQQESKDEALQSDKRQQLTAAKKSYKEINQKFISNFKKISQSPSHESYEQIPQRKENRHFDMYFKNFDKDKSNQTDYSNNWKEKEGQQDYFLSRLPQNIPYYTQEQEQTKVIQNKIINSSKKQNNQSNNDEPVVRCSSKLDYQIGNQLVQQKNDFYDITFKDVEDGIANKEKNSLQRCQQEDNKKSLFQNELTNIDILYENKMKSLKNLNRKSPSQKNIQTSFQIQQFKGAD